MLHLENIIAKALINQKFLKQSSKKIKFIKYNTKTLIKIFYVEQTKLNHVKNKLGVVWLNFLYSKNRMLLHTKILITKI